MNQMVPQNFGPMSTRFQGAAQDNDLGAGVQAGFGIIGYKGKVWSIRYRGDELQLMRDDGDGPRNSIEIVILKAATAVSKIWYENGYTDGSHQQPDCFSTNGVTPDMASPKKQAASCANCPMNAWGSRITPSGKAGKACSDSKRLAVAPLGDIDNEVFGGPLLLRVPAASLQDLAQFGKVLQKMGYFYNAVGVRVSFDPAEPYPKFQFNAIRPLTDEEADKVLEMQKTPQVDRILAEGAEHAPATQQQGEQPSPNSIFEQPPQQGQQSPSTGQTPAQPAQHAATTGSPAASSQPTSVQGTPPTQDAGQENQSGGASDAPVQSSGFGNMAPANQQVPQGVTGETPKEDPTTGQGSSASAQTAEATGQTQPSPAQDAPNTPAPQENPSSDGGASSAAPKPSKSSSTEPSEGSTEGSDFEATLDDQLSKLLPS